MKYSERGVENPDDARFLVKRDESFPQTPLKGKKPKYPLALALGILSITFGSVAGGLLAIPGIILSAMKEKEYDVKVPLVCSLIGLTLFLAGQAVFVYILFCNFLGLI